MLITCWMPLLNEQLDDTLAAGAWADALAGTRACVATSAAAAASRISRLIPNPLVAADCMDAGPRLTRPCYRRVTGGLEDRSYSATGWLVKPGCSAVSRAAS